MSELKQVVPAMPDNMMAETNSEARYTVYTVCRHCGKAKGKKRPQSLFCSDRCRFTSHNEARRNRNRTTLGGGAKQAVATVNEQKLERVRHRRKILLLTKDELEAGIARAREAEARIATFDAAADLSIVQVLEVLNVSRSRLYQLIDAGRFPRGRVVYGPRRGQRVVCWRTGVVAEWLRNRDRVS